MNNHSMLEQVCVVTGASRGIGRAIAEHLAAIGATVIGTATSAAGAANITEYLRSAGAKGLGMELHVEQAESREAFRAAVEERFTGISVLVNNAGIIRDDLTLRMKEHDWDAVLETNLSAVFHMSKLFMRNMTKARYGRIINITSVVGHLGNAGQTNYAAAKAGVAGMSRSLALELGSRNITVNCVAPGYIETDMTAALDPTHLQVWLAQIPLGRLGQAKEVAEVVSFLASPAAAYVTGSTLHVNGGMFMA